MHALEKRCFSLPWSLEQCRLSFSRLAFAAFGLFSEQEALFAYISFYHVADEMEILNLAVVPEMRRQGHGHFLLTTALKAGRKLGIQKVWLEVREHNTAALALYAGCGFQPCGRRNKYYTDTGEDALVLALTLSA
ncbi:MAG: ribosomal protein S18-alanine N-acetyltransferase [Desulfovibrio sp.]|nr:ribosomal protein S18-alanine N-acetyltransferase [Desulfovibrio sp.]